MTTQVTALIIEVNTGCPHPPYSGDLKMEANMFMMNMEANSGNL